MRAFQMPSDQIVFLRSWTEQALDDWKQFDWTLNESGYTGRISVNMPSIFSDGQSVDLSIYSDELPSYRTVTAQTAPAPYTGMVASGSLMLVEYKENGEGIYERRPIVDGQAGKSAYPRELSYGMRGEIQAGMAFKIRDEVHSIYPDEGTVVISLDDGQRGATYRIYGLRGSTDRGVVERPATEDDVRMAVAAAQENWVHV